jgi:hypothetical protein
MQRKRADGYIEDIETPEEKIRELELEIARLKEALEAALEKTETPVEE